MRVRGRAGTAATARRRWARVWGWTTTVLLTIVVLAALLIVGLPLALGAQTYTVLTGSMRPSIEPGALIAVRAVEPADIRIGDVVTYQRESGKPETVTHRVVGLALDGGGDILFTTRGDANDLDDPAVVPAQVRGVVVYVLPWLGYPHLFVSGATRAGIVAVVGVAVIAYGVAVLVIDMFRRRRPRPVSAASDRRAPPPALP